MAAFCSADVAGGPGRGQCAADTRLRRLRLCLGAVGLLVAAGWLTACTAPANLVGRWHRLDLGPRDFIGDPLASLAQPDLELRDQGLLVDLLVDAGSGRAVTTVTGGYAVLDASHLQITGRCYQGYASRACSQTYTFTLAGDHLTVRDGTNPNAAVDYQRVGPVAATQPPTVAPPGPSATP